MGNEFSKAIYELRLGRKLSQRAAAQSLGISQALLSHYENGVRQPKLAFVKKIATFYDVSADKLLGHSCADDRCVSEPEQRLRDELTAVIERVEAECGFETAELFCGYLAAAADNARRIIEEPDSPHDPRRYLNLTAAEAALYDDAKSRGATK